ncbi:ParB/RepB/Spo0J family partition protein [Micromonospora sp. DT81.3]|uniref:ParB/RepB/Spo0J family partition protein n=1 Tax=Micromonospora sp. DT81.3 TaxID=3416523 RepID=UPI003CE6B0E4
MMRIDVNPDDLVVSRELARSGSSRSFEERLRASIDQIGLAEPLKVAADPSGGYVVIDGALRLRAIEQIRSADPSRFPTVPVYVLDYEKRYEIRYQSDIYQDLLPSQLATLVEHLHQSEHVLKTDIAKYIGVSPATLRNYTGLSRLMQREGLFARVVELMDIGVLPSSNPYAWLRLTAAGLERVLQESFSDGQPADAWIDGQVSAARLGHAVRFPIKWVETATDGLPPDCYREHADVRRAKRDLGLRKGGTAAAAVYRRGPAWTKGQAALAHVLTESREPVLKTAASTLMEYLR